LLVSLDEMREDVSAHVTVVASDGDCVDHVLYEVR
jgi:hypothetical protein